MTAAAETIQARLLPRFHRSWAWIAAQRSNPVLVRDLRALFRGRRVALTQLGYLVALAAAMGLAAIAARSQHAMYGFQGVRAAPEYGKWMFISLYETQVVLVLLIAVAYSAGAISLEREKQTYDALAMTGLKSVEVVLGKIWSVSLLCWLLLVTATPLAAFCVFFGGISPGEIALSYGLLALKVPLWAALGVLASILTGRSVSAYVAALILVGAENFGAFLTTAPLSELFGQGSGIPVSIGLFNPFLAPYASELTFACFGLPISPALLPLVYTLLLTALVVVGSAEAMTHYRPSRSRPLRGLLLAVTFFFAAVIVANSLHTVSAGTSSFPLGGAMIATWMWACLFVPIFTSYPPPAETSAPDRLALRPARWLDRHPATGGGFCVLLWLVALLGLFAPLVLGWLLSPTAARVAGSPAGIVSQVFPAPTYLLDIPGLGLAIPIALLGIVAYAAWGSVLALVHKERREAGLGALLIILAMNACAVVFALGYYVMRKPPTAAPLVLASPAAAAAAVLAHGTRASKFARYSLDEALIYGVGYSLLLLLGAWYYYRRAQEKQRSPASSSSALDPGAAEERSEES
jgi:hypothetical protein